jgi:tetrahydromethanopterin S-methyltransferase subunit B
LDEEKQSDAIRREASLAGFWAGILLLALIGIAIFVAFKLASSMLGV